KQELSPKSIRNLIIGGIILIALIYIGSSSFYTVQEREKAVVYTFGKITQEQGSGLHFKLPSPIQKVKIVPAELTQTITIGYRQTDSGDQVIEEEAMMITG